MRTRHTDAEWAAMSEVEYYQTMQNLTEFLKQEIAYGIDGDHERFMSANKDLLACGNQLQLRPAIWVIPTNPAPA